MSITLRYAKNYDDAVEMANDGFYKIYKDLKKFEPKYANAAVSFAGWLKRVVINSSIDYLRKYNKYNNVIEINETTTQVYDASENGQDVLLYKEIMQCVEKLGDKLKIVFNLFVIDGLSHNEISEKLSIPINTSKSYLFKAKQELKDLLKKNDFVAYERAV
jgi:RNA polymerase sigma-70 factor (ECF subfamily)